LTVVLDEEHTVRDLWMCGAGVDLGAEGERCFERGAGGGHDAYIAKRAVAPARGVSPPTGGPSQPPDEDALPFPAPGIPARPEVASSWQTPCTMSHPMQLDEMLDRCRGLEERVAAVYRAYAAAAREDPASTELCTTLAREEEQHVESIVRARSRLRPTVGWPTWRGGWEEPVEEVEPRLRIAEKLGPEATTAARLSAALELEITELEELREALLATSAAPDGTSDHATRLAEAATALSN